VPVGSGSAECGSRRCVALGEPVGQGFTGCKYMTFGRLAGRLGSPGTRIRSRSSRTARCRTVPPID